jgi:exopolyphosphatase/guanosine-5'-triphosphate,3'-diphosphate pyrophosphatase
LSARVRAATIDIGTNSVLLLIAEVRGTDVQALLERATITRLGQGVDKSGVLAAEAIERTAQCLAAYAEEIARHGVSHTAAVATSAMRDARDGDRFLERATAILGVAPEVISGKREAELTFEGALMGLMERADERVAVFDVGGGSTEIIVGRGAVIEHAVSLDIGAVRLTERHIAGDPPSAAQLAEVRATIRRALEAAPPIAGLPIVGVAGTVTTLAAIVHDVVPYDPSRIHGASIGREELAHIVERLASMTLADRRALAALDPWRADVIVAGGLLVEAIADCAHARTLTVSDRGVRWGLVKRMEKR